MANWLFIAIALWVGIAVVGIVAAALIVASIAFDKAADRWNAWLEAHPIVHSLWIRFWMAFIGILILVVAFSLGGLILRFAGVSA